MRSSEEKVQNALDSLSDGVEGVGPGVHVHHVGPLRRLNLLVPCSATKQNIAGAGERAPPVSNDLRVRGHVEHGGERKEDDDGLALAWPDAG